VSNGGPDLAGGTAGRLAGKTEADGKDARAIATPDGRTSGRADWSAWEFAKVQPESMPQPAWAGCAQQGMVAWAGAGLALQQGMVQRSPPAQAGATHARVSRTARRR